MAIVGNKNTADFSGLAIWAMAFGCVIGWGSIVLPGTVFVPGAGPVGTVIGVIIGAVMCLIVCQNYAWMVHQFPHNRGSYFYTKSILGEDHAFLVVWSIALAYISILWANASTFVVLFRSVFGDTFQWGYMYNIAGYDVYLGEVLTTIAIKTTFCLITTYAVKTANFLRKLFAITLFGSVVVIFVGVVKECGLSVMLNPMFTDDEPIWVQLMNVAAYAPFLYVGFETVTHAVGQTKFPVSRIYAYAGASILAGMIVYIFLALTATAGVPEGYVNWKDYMADLGNLEGLQTIPVFFNVHKYMGDTGVWLMVAVGISALATGVLGFHRAEARVLAIMAKWDLLPKKLAEENEHGVPVKASLVVLVISIPVFFVGRTAIGWNADVASFASAIVYAYISVCTLKTALKNGSKRMKLCGILGVATMVFIFIFLLLPNVFAKNVFSKESYLLLTAWSLVGMIYYWIMFWRDKEHRFGKSTIMWLVMVVILFFATTMWSQANMLEELNLIAANCDSPTILFWDNILELTVITIAVIFLFSLFTMMMKRQRDLYTKYIRAEQHKKSVISENEVLTRYSTQLKMQKEEIERQKARIQKQRDQIQSSIQYAYHIQHSLLTPDSVVSDIFPDSFLLYKPRNVVSGDFYWMDKFGDYKVCVVGDCTGHGVPGGFMSMLGITNLNYIVGRVLDPDRILNKLREAIITDLRQRDDEPLDAIPPTQQDRSRDGMDCAIYVINEKDNTLTFAGANNPLVIIRNNEIIVHKADKMPVGIYLKMEPFTSTEIQLQKGDCLYTFSDGYQDQLNHITKKKFLSIHLRELLLEIHELPMEQQKAILEQTFDDWRGPEEKQVDDVVIFGVRI